MKNAITKAKQQTGERRSGIELLKVVGIFLIVLSHTCQTLGDVLPLGTATTDVQRIILTNLRYSGTLGNTIFFICSAWFLLDSNKASAKKIISMIVDVWVISMILLAFTYIVNGGVSAQRTL